MATRHPIQIKENQKLKTNELRLVYIPIHQYDRCDDI